MGRPEVYGLKVITGDRVRRARFALCTGSTRIKVAKRIFKFSPKTLRRYMQKDDIRSKVLKRAIEEGEELRDQPLGLLICYLLDKRDETQALLGEYRHELPENIEEVEADYLRLREEAREYESRLHQALTDNKAVKKYQKTWRV